MRRPPAKWQATPPPAPGTKGGGTVGADRLGARAARMEAAAGGIVGDARHDAFGCPSGCPAPCRAARDAADQRLRIGMARVPRRSRRPVPCSATRPAYITTTRSQACATTPMSWVISISASPRCRDQIDQEPDDLRLDRHVERRGRLVGDQQVGIGGKRHGDDDALLHAAGQLVRIEMVDRGRLGDAQLRHQLDAARPRRRPVEPEMQPRTT